MALKRKRSSPALADSPSSVASGTSTLGGGPSSPSPPSFAAHPAHLHRQEWPRYGPHTSFSTNRPERPHLDSRTRKRWRDARPDRATVEARTLDRLFAAQRRGVEEPLLQVLDTHMDGDAGPGMQRPPKPCFDGDDGHAAQMSLHAFWDLPRHHITSVQSTLRAAESLAVPSSDFCETCGGALASCDADTMMGDDVGLAMSQETAQHSCDRCGTRLCDNCAVWSTGGVCLRCV